ncbi:MAG: hypothetical protein ACJ71A_00950 [Nitrososphaeraceae archaeon]
MAESSTGSSSIGFGNTKYPYYYGPEGRLVLDERPNNGQLMINPKYQEQKKNEEVSDRIVRKRQWFW